VIESRNKKKNGGLALFNLKSTTQNEWQTPETVQVDRVKHSDR